MLYWIDCLNKERRQTVRLNKRKHSSFQHDSSNLNKRKTQFVLIRHTLSESSTHSEDGHISLRFNKEAALGTADVRLDLGSMVKP